MYRRSAPLIFVTGLATLLGGLGCATLVTGTHQRVRLEAAPEGTYAVVDGRLRLETPAEVELDKLRAHRVRFEKEGFVAVERRIRRQVQPWVLGNVFVLLLPGMLVDFLTGGAYRLERVVAARLRPEGRDGVLGDDAPSETPQKVGAPVTPPPPILVPRE